MSSSPMHVRIIREVVGSVESEVLYSVQGQAWRLISIEDSVEDILLPVHWQIRNGLQADIGWVALDNAGHTHVNLAQ